MMKETEVVVYQGTLSGYSSLAPFHPALRYPEYEFETIGVEGNPAYEGVREAFRMAGLDQENFGSSQWNPLGGLIRPGEVVLLKPNMLKESHPSDPNGWQYVMTHGSVIRAVADYVWKALSFQGKILIADAPQTDSSFSEISRVLGLDSLRNFYRSRGLFVEVIDLRQEEWVNKDSVIVRRSRLPGDPNGAVAFDLGMCSELADHPGSGRYYGADYDAGVVNLHHTMGRHEYLIAGSAIGCDVIFNLPKLKTHKKAGITVGLKNLVGVTGDKNWLPHHTEGDPSSNGDEHPGPGIKHRLERELVGYFQQLCLRAPTIGTWLYRKLRKIGVGIFGDTEEVVRSGNWWGNDTTWRMCLDLNKIVFYGSLNGTLHPSTPENRKRHYVLVDGIIAGEGRGPLIPDPVHAGILVFGIHPASVDAACAYLMGYDPERIPIVRQAFRCRNYPLAEWDWRDVRIISNRRDWNCLLPDIADEATFHFEPHFGWKGHIERRGL